MLWFNSPCSFQNIFHCTRGIIAKSLVMVRRRAVPSHVKKWHAGSRGLRARQCMPRDAMPLCTQLGNISSQLPPSLAKKYINNNNNNNNNNNKSSVLGCQAHASSCQAVLGRSSAKRNRTMPCALIFRSTPQPRVPRLGMFPLERGERPPEAESPLSGKTTNKSVPVQHCR